MKSLAQAQAVQYSTHNQTTAASNIAQLCCTSSLPGCTNMVYTRENYVGRVE